MSDSRALPQSMPIRERLDIAIRESERLRTESRERKETAQQLQDETRQFIAASRQYPWRQGARLLAQSPANAVPALRIS